MRLLLLYDNVLLSVNVLLVKCTALPVYFNRRMHLRSFGCRAVKFCSFCVDALLKDNAQQFYLHITPTPTLTEHLVLFDSTNLFSFLFRCKVIPASFYSYFSMKSVLIHFVVGFEHQKRPCLRVFISGHRFTPNLRDASWLRRSVTLLLRPPNVPTFNQGKCALLNKKRGKQKLTSSSREIRGSCVGVSRQLCWRVAAVLVCLISSHLSQV